MIIIFIIQIIYKIQKVSLRHSTNNSLQIFNTIDTIFDFKSIFNTAITS